MKIEQWSCQNEQVVRTVTSHQRQMVEETCFLCCSQQHRCVLETDPQFFQLSLLRGLAQAKNQNIQD